MEQYMELNIFSHLYDERINALNISAEISIKEYLLIAKNIIKNNIYQRRKVKSSSTVYELLREDIKRGCVIPPIVLALSKSPANLNIKDLKDNQTYSRELIQENKDNLIILDGLQRTHTIIDLESELIDKKDESIIKNFYNHKIRIEIYVGINKLGILYRMLTLNTGQTPMSLRHQIEILYLDYLNIQIEGVNFLKETDDVTPEKVGEYKFKDIIEGFNSYLERNELPLDRMDILENIKSLEKLSKENQDVDIFKEYLITFHGFILKIITLSNNWNYIEDENPYSLSGQPFGKNAFKIFARSQVMTGFGASLGKLVDKGLIIDFNEAKSLTDKITIGDNVNNTFYNINKFLDKIRATSPKIGNAQRMYFQYFFRELYNKESDSFLDLDASIENAYKKYESQTM
jgi:hypothetical protein